MELLKIRELEVEKNEAIEKRKRTIYDGQSMPQLIRIRAELDQENERL
jgi:hypothetical protein